MCYCQPAPNHGITGETGERTCQNFLRSVSYLKIVKMMKRAFCITVVTLFLLSACTSAPIRPKGEEAPLVDAQEVPQEEAEQKSLELFTEVLTISASSRDRAAVLPRIEETYLRIITEYPDAPLAQESYWRLITIYLNDYAPPLYEKAEPLYRDFVSNYPKGTFTGFIQESLSKSYFRYRKWDRLLAFTEPIYLEYIREGTLPRPLVMFMYAEARYRLGHIPEAKEGFREMIRLYPKASEKAQERLDEIQKL